MADAYRSEGKPKKSNMVRLSSSKTTNNLDWKNANDTNHTNELPILSILVYYFATSRHIHFSFCV